jgi:HAD superfamily hydrolase (TIGR01509 family)
MTSSNDAPALAAAVFDLDGVITFTARVHAAAWKQLFDEYLRSREQRLGESFREFDAEGDYQKYVDGKPRYDGVQSFLTSRGIQLPWGSPSDAPGTETVCGLGNRKDELFIRRVREFGVEYDHDAVAFVRELAARGVHVGLASSSRNAKPILAGVGLSELFEAVVDGVVSDQLHLRGKPEPDIFLTCLDRLVPGAEPARGMVVEDAIAGVEAGRRGNFGLVLGVDRVGQADALRANGADRVIRSFREISADEVLSYFRSRARVA